MKKIVATRFVTFLCNRIVAQIAEVSVEGDAIKVHPVVCAIDCGLVVRRRESRAAAGPSMKSLADARLWPLCASVRTSQCAFAGPFFRRPLQPHGQSVDRRRIVSLEAKGFSAMV